MKQAPKVLRVLQVRSVPLDRRVLKVFKVFPALKGLRARSAQ